MTCGVVRKSPCPPLELQIWGHFQKQRLRNKYEMEFSILMLVVTNQYIFVRDTICRQDNGRHKCWQTVT